MRASRNASPSKKFQAQLLAHANKARLMAYAPYSGFRVGAALLTVDNSIFTGCNVENSCYSLTICAERNAVFKAVAEGQTRFKALAIASDSKEFLPPCGACRQVLSEFAPRMTIILSNAAGQTRSMSLSKLLPKPANLKHLRKRSAR